LRGVPHKLKGGELGDHWYAEQQKGLCLRTSPRMYSKYLKKDLGQKLKERLGPCWGIKQKSPNLGKPRPIGKNEGGEPEKLSR